MNPWDKAQAVPQGTLIPVSVHIKKQKIGFNTMSILQNDNSSLGHSL